MFTVINDCNALGEFAQWAQNVIDEESDKSDLLSKLIGDDGTFASSIKMTVGEANIHSLDMDDQKMTYDWYTVDRTTGCGYDSTGEEIDITVVERYLGDVGDTTQ